MPREGGASSTPRRKLAFTMSDAEYWIIRPSARLCTEADDDSGMGSYPSNASIDARLPRETSVSSATGSPSPLSRKRLVMG